MRKSALCRKKEMRVMTVLPYDAPNEIIRDQIPRVAMPPVTPRCGFEKKK